MFIKMSQITQYHWFSCNFFGSAGIQTQKCGFQPKMTENAYLWNQTQCENGQYHFFRQFRARKTMKKKMEFGLFFAILGPFLAFLALFDMFVIFFHFSPYLVIICNFLAFFDICYHFLAFFCPFWEIYMLMYFKAFQPIFSCFSHCINFQSILAIIPNSFLPVLSQLSKTLRLFLAFSAKI